ncbi:hypothetical protein FB45DRAFT_924637 [Roridomyces roridus]|uniref:Uncharacterized protein n=1 Tax=Roridomyces roridus TaxID=1738132 RepID=A0AAD7BLY5_9AGAR|nr:hypothetical protein FB45DRAFT_924637 [Roridomyces roridus]
MPCQSALSKAITFTIFFVCDLAAAALQIALIATHQHDIGWWRIVLLVCTIIISISAGLSTWRAWSVYEAEKGLENHPSFV